GTKVGTGQSIEVYVSLGKSQVTVPPMTNLSEAAAKAALEQRGLKEGSVTTEHSPSIAAGVVIRSTPESNTSANAGDTVDLVVSDGMVTVPDVRGMAITDANKALSALQLSVTNQGDSSCNTYKVSAQSLPPGDQPQRSAVTLTYCSGG
ncbi:MAG: PASTA domain-containing protein, partial [Lacisediminihabitans sp.]